MRKLAIVMSVMMVIALTAGVSLAAQKAAKVQTVTGEVIKVDAKTGDIVIKFNNKDHALKAEPKMLTGIMTGEKVTIEKSGKTVKSIIAAQSHARVNTNAKVETPVKKEAPKTE